MTLLIFFIELLWCGKFGKSLLHSHRFILGRKVCHIFIFLRFFYQALRKSAKNKETDLALQKVSTERFVFSSSITADVWHPQKDPKAYEWWYFDALSDDGSEAVVIVFLDNFIYSPRYYATDRARSNGLATESKKQRFPAVSITYYRDGKQVYRAVNEYLADQFTANESCTGVPDRQKLVSI